MYPPTPLPPAPVESPSGSPGGGGHCGRPGSALLDTGPFYLRLRENAAPSAAPCGLRAAGWASCGHTVVWGWTWGPDVAQGRPLGHLENLSVLAAAAPWLPTAGDELRDCTRA